MHFLFPIVTVLQLHEGAERRIERGKWRDWWSSGLDSALLLQGVPVQSLVRELRSHVPCSAAK